LFRILTVSFTFFPDSNLLRCAAFVMSSSSFSHY
jgi:hypothetical protein